MKFAEVLKKSFLEGYGAVSIDFATIVTCMAITVLVAAYIFMVYRMVNRKAFYNRNFNLALIALAVITAAVILTIQSNIVISLGMVGALSIVRFRTAVKDPMESGVSFLVDQRGHYLRCGFRGCGGSCIDRDNCDNIIV